MIILVPYHHKGNGYGVFAVLRHTFFFRVWGEFGVNVVGEFIQDFGGFGLREAMTWL